MYQLLIFVLFFEIFFRDNDLFLFLLIFITDEFLFHFMHRRQNVSCIFLCTRDKYLSRDIFILIHDRYLSRIFLLFTNKYLLCISFISMSNCFLVFIFIFIGDKYLSHLSVKFIVYSWISSRVTHLRVIRGFNVRILINFYFNKSCKIFFLLQLCKKLILNRFSFF